MAFGINWPTDKAQPWDTQVNTFVAYKDNMPCQGPKVSNNYGKAPSSGPSQMYNNVGNQCNNVFPRISKPVELLRSSYDCVVIGSGYGGGVAASRMARAGQKICLLERGKERWPGEYPTRAVEAFKQLHVTGEFAPGWTKGVPLDEGDPTGLYHLIMGQGQDAFVANGLGGTSLLNANVFLETDAQTLAMDVWPNEIRENPECLDKFYKRAEQMLEPEKYPDDWPALPKAEMLKRQAAALGLSEKFHRVRQTTRFKNGPNSTGVEMNASTLTGMDSTGINDGSKSSTLVNYLADAWNWGAEMFCECEVRYIEKAPIERGGYLVYFAWHGEGRGTFKANFYSDLMWVHAKEAVFLGAGAIGSTEILLRSKELGLPVSSRLGTGMSGNGDILAFGYNTDTNVNTVGRPYPSPYSPIGTTITSIIDVRKGHENPLDGYVIEEGALPMALAPLFQTMLELTPNAIKPQGETPYEKAQHFIAQLGSRLLGPYFKNGAVERTMIYLIMSHDSNQAILSLKDDKPQLEFIGVGRSQRVHQLDSILQHATKAVGGTFILSPFYAVLGRQEITVHPIGGCCMSRDDTADQGVTNQWGEVLIGTTEDDGKEIHEGLIVMDGAIIPTALGANPLATITALAERNVDHYCLKNGLSINWERNDVLDLFGSPKHSPWERDVQMCKMNAHLEEDEQEGDTMTVAATVALIKETKISKASGVGFTEIMSGFIHFAGGLGGDDSLEAYRLAFRTAKSLGQSARFFLSIKAWNTEEMVNRCPDHSAMLTGSFVCAGIPGSPFIVQRGHFQLFYPDDQSTGKQNLIYDFDMKGVDGSVYHFFGFKAVDSGVALAPHKFWKALTTLYVTITKPAPDQVGPIGEVIAKGIMSIQPLDFVSEMMTLRSSGRNVIAKALSTFSFLSYFVNRSLPLFLAPFSSLQYPSVTYSGFINNTPPDQTFTLVASDGVHTLLHVWEPTNTNIKTKNLFMIPGASVDHQIYALPTIEVNAINYFTRTGYRCFVLVHRIGQLMVAENHWTTFDARLDIKAALEQIRERYGPHKIYTIAHCMGSVAFSCGLLDGTIPASWILGITCSQVFMNPVWMPLNMAKVMAGPIQLDKLYGMLAGSWFSCSTSTEDTFVQKAINQVLRFYPDYRKEICSNASCHRVSFVFGRCWNHDNLNEATHRQINRFFGGVNMTLLHLLMKQGFEGHVMSNAPLYENLVTPMNISRLRNIPFFFFCGADSQVLSPMATEKTYEILCDTFGDANFKRRVIPSYGHLDCWMGRNAYKDVYPIVRKEVDRVVRGVAVPM